MSFDFFTLLFCQCVFCTTTFVQCTYILNFGLNHPLSGTGFNLGAVWPAVTNLSDIVSLTPSHCCNKSVWHHHNADIPFVTFACHPYHTWSNLPKKTRKLNVVRLVPSKFTSRFSDLWTTVTGFRLSAWFAWFAAWFACTFTSKKIWQLAGLHLSTVGIFHWPSLTYSSVTSPVTSFIELSYFRTRFPQQQHQPVSDLVSKWR